MVSSLLVSSVPSISAPRTGQNHTEPVGDAEEDPMVPYSQNSPLMGRSAWQRWGLCDLEPCLRAMSTKGSLSVPRPTLRQIESG